MVVKPDEVPSGQLAVIVTYLEMTVAPDAPVPPSPLRLRPARRDVAGYRALFKAVGSRWLWFSRLVMPEAQLQAILSDPAVDICEVVKADGQAVGLVELDFSRTGECEISFLGLVPELAGQSHGRWLLAQTLCRAWRPGVRRVHLHTCTLDHPAALPAYCRAGFVAYRRSVERFADPRLAGILPPDCAPQVPVVVGTLADASAAPVSCA